MCDPTACPYLEFSLATCLRKDPFKPFAEIAFVSVSRDLPSLVPAASPASPDQARIPHTAVDEMNSWQVGGHGRATKTPTCAEHSDPVSNLLLACGELVMNV